MAANARMRAERLSASGRLRECQGCGSRAAAGRATHRCPLCGWTHLRPCMGAGHVVAPDGLLPFAVDRSSAHRSIRRWAWSRWLAPLGWARAVTRSSPADVYLPYWVLDADVEAHYRGLRGEDRPDSGLGSGLRPRRPDPSHRPIRWRPVQGSVRLRVSGLRICASRSLPESLLDRLPAPDLSAQIPHRPQRLLAAWTERYAMEPAEASSTARARVEHQLREAARAAIGGDQQRIHDLHVDVHGERFTHLLVPLWSLVIRHGDRRWRVLVDGRSGRVVGEHPRSVAKLAALVGLAGALLWLMML